MNAVEYHCACPACRAARRRTVRNLWWAWIGFLILVTALVVEALHSVANT